jgi:hypothetical protein
MTLDQQCMDVAGVQTGDGVSVEQWTCNGQLNQQYVLQLDVASPADASTDASPPLVDAAAEAGSVTDAGDAGVGLVTLISKNSGMCVTILGAGAVQTPCIGATSQKWFFNPVSGGSQIVSALD